LNKLR